MILRKLSVTLGIGNFFSLTVYEEYADIIQYKTEIDS